MCSQGCRLSGPASSSRRRCSPEAVSRFASTQPALPAPTIMKSKLSSISATAVASRSPAPLGKPPPAQRPRGARWSACPVADAGSMKPRPVLGVEQVAIAGVEAERYRAAGLQRRARPYLGDQPVSGGAVEMHERGVAERLGELHRALERGAVAQDDMLGPHPE